MFEISEKLTLEQTDEIFGVFSNQLGKICLETIISGQWWRSHQSLACKGLCILRFCVMSWKGESEPSIQYCLGTAVGLVQRFIIIQNFGHSWRRTYGIRVEYFHRIHYMAARPRSSKVHERNGWIRTIPRTNYFHVDVQWHHMEKLKIMKRNLLLIPHLLLFATRCPAVHRSYFGLGSETKWYITTKDPK